MFDQLKDMGKLLKQAQEMKSQMKKIQKELRLNKMNSESPNGKIKITINGEIEFEDIKIDPNYLKTESAEKVSTELLQGVNDAIKKAKDVAASKLSAVTGGMNIPGLK